jgi:hypothetical protein
MITPKRCSATAVQLAKKCFNASQEKCNFAKILLD